MLTAQDVLYNFSFLGYAIDNCANTVNNVPHSGLLWWGKSGGFGLSPQYFTRSIIFPAIIKPADSAFWVSGGAGHDTFHVAFNMFNKHI